MAYSKHQGTKAGKQPRATQKATSSKAWEQSSATNSLQSSSTHPRQSSSTQPRPGWRSGAPKGSSQLSVVEVLEEYFGLGLRHGAPSIRVDDDMRLRVTGKVVTVVTGRTEEIRKVEPAIISVLSLLRVGVADSI